MEEKSKRFRLNKTDGLKIAKGAGIAVGGALVVYLTQVLTQVDFGAWTPLVVALGGILINTFRQYLVKHT